MYITEIISIAPSDLTFAPGKNWFDSLLLQTITTVNVWFFDWVYKAQPNFKLGFLSYDLHLHQWSKGTVLQGVCFCLIHIKRWSVLIGSLACRNLRSNLSSPNVEYLNNSWEELHLLAALIHVTHTWSFIGHLSLNFLKRMFIKLTF